MSNRDFKLGDIVDNFNTGIRGEIVDFDESGFAEIELKWGNKHNDHEQYSDLVEYNIEKFYHAFDKMKIKNMETV